MPQILTHPAMSKLPALTQASIDAAKRDRIAARAKVGLDPDPHDVAPLQVSDLAAVILAYGRAS
jgi:hypothetical protein